MWLEGPRSQTSPAQASLHPESFKPEDEDRGPGPLLPWAWVGIEDSVSYTLERGGILGLRSQLEPRKGHCGNCCPGFSHVPGGTVEPALHFSRKRRERASSPVPHPSPSRGQKSQLFQRNSWAEHVNLLTVWCVSRGSLGSRGGHGNAASRIFLHIPLRSLPWDCASW